MSSFWREDYGSVVLTHSPLSCQHPLSELLPFWIPASFTHVMLLPPNRTLQTFQHFISLFLLHWQLWWVVVFSCYIPVNLELSAAACVTFDRFVSSHLRTLIGGMLSPFVQRTMANAPETQEKKKNFTYRMGVCDEGCKRSRIGTPHHSRNQEKMVRH